MNSSNPLRLVQVLLLSSSIIRNSLVCGLLLLLPLSYAHTQSSVWVVTSGEEKVYLGGTVHLLRPTDYPLPAPFETAYQDSDKLFFETNIAGLSDFSVQARMMQALTYSDSTTLRSVLNDEAYAALSAHVATVGLPLQMMEKFKPGLLISTLQVIEFQKMGFTPQGVDAYFNSRAMEDAKPVGQLEPIDAQIGFIANMGVGHESEFVLLSIEDMKEIPTTMDQMVSAWRAGDNEMLADLFVDDMKEGYPALYEELLVDRNNNWMPLIENMFREEGTEFVLVGAAHLVGDDGLLSLLEKKGYQISRVQ
ncbi:MAG: TraB/GumN family protein [Gammaproteobacteria bacterium]|nr:TraB/GumN family protein [Gammaproteobacteria bacterium]